MRRGAVGARTRSSGWEAGPRPAFAIRRCRPVASNARPGGGSATCTLQCRRGPCARRSPRCRVAANAMYALRLRRLPALRGGDRAWRCRHQPLPARGRDDDRRARRGGRDGAEALGCELRRPRSAQGRCHRRGALHRLHAVHRRLPGRRDPWHLEAHARDTAGAVFGLRAVRRAVPGRLHPDGRCGS